MRKGVKERPTDRQRVIERVGERDIKRDGQTDGVMVRETERREK